MCIRQLDCMIARIDGHTHADKGVTPRFAHRNLDCLINATTCGYDSALADADVRVKSGAMHNTTSLGRIDMPSHVLHAPITEAHNVRRMASLHSSQHYKQHTTQHNRAAHTVPTNTHCNTMHPHDNHISQAAGGTTPVSTHANTSAHGRLLTW